MPLENSLGSSPYFDDYDQTKEFYRVLFKPGVAVQTRELNQLQSVLQNQIERFGDHVFKSGTIVSGVNFSYMPTYSFVKITDLQGDGEPSLPSSYKDYYIKSNLNLTARVVNYEDGLESKAPDLKTLYLQYINSSDPDTSNGSAIYTEFKPDQDLTVFSKQNELFKVIVNNGGLGFSNADTVVVQSAVTVSGNTVAFTNTEVVTQATTGAKATIVGINATAVANTIILRLRPLLADLANTSKTSAAWTFQAGYNIVGNTSTATANVTSLIGTGASAFVNTDSLGIVQNIVLANTGSGYSFLPIVTIKTSNTTATLNNLDLAAQNYKAVVTVGNSSVNAVGTGYAFGVTEGVIYQKGFFLRVDPQVIVVDKYTTTPNNVAIGFKTVESTVDANEDESLYDNAANTLNYTAPGADRLKLTPTLTKMTLDESYANVDFFALAEWKDGVPYKENRTTIYNTLGDELARRTREAQGNFVADPFVITTKESSTLNANNVQVVVDPGLAYISGYRVQTMYNNYLNVARSSTSTSFTNQSITVNYGNYVYVKELVGLLDFKAGATVSLRDTAKTYASTTTLATGTTITAPGSEIGTARIRSLVIDNGIPGTPDATYRLYLFDVQMNAGQTFRSVKSAYYTAASGDGIADLILETDATTSSSVAVLHDTTHDQMVFPVSQPGVKTISNVTYTYRTVSDTTLKITTSGTVTITVGSGLTHPYTAGGNLSDTQKRDLIVFPIANTQAAANAAGSVSVTSGANTVTGTSTTFATSFSVGDFVKIANSTANVVGRISKITNNTSMALTSTVGSSISGNAVLFIPALYPIPLESRSARIVSLAAGGQVLTINLANTFAAEANVVVTYNVRKSGAAATAKTIGRDRLVKLYTANNAAGNTGPWSLGIPGLARLKNVYISDSSTVNVNSTDVTKYFFIDNNDDENVYRPARLTLQNPSAYSVNSTAYMLVKFDVFTTNDTGGFFSIGSYSINDSANLASSNTTINLLEVPELITRQGNYIDLRDAIDFRPYANVVANVTSNASLATLNPANTFTLTSAAKLFPAPDSQITFDIEYYNYRVDVVTVDKNSNFSVIAGMPALTQPAPQVVTSDVVKLTTLFVPPYPSLPASVNARTMEFLTKRIGNSRGAFDGRRASSYTIRTRLDKSVTSPQPLRYTMADIGNLERRINELEYAVALNKAEAQIRDLVIPSAITPTINRFKNAFFVDSFNDFSKASVQDREFAATIDTVKGTLKPVTKQLNVQAKFDRTDSTTNNAVVGNQLMLPYAEETLIDQSVRSAVVTPPVRAQFCGSGTITPPTFEIQDKIEGGSSLPATPVYSDWSSLGWGGGA